MSTFAVPLQVPSGIIGGHSPAWRGWVAGTQMWLAREGGKKISKQETLKSATIIQYTIKGRFMSR